MINYIKCIITCKWINNLKLEDLLLIMRNCEPEDGYLLLTELLYWPNEHTRRIASNNESLWDE